MIVIYPHKYITNIMFFQYKSYRILILVYFNHNKAARLIQCCDQMPYIKKQSRSWETALRNFIFPDRGISNTF